MDIIVNLRVEGFHCFPKAKELFPEVAFLADKHRHIFHICCKKKVSHDDRDIEIIIFKRNIEGWLKTMYHSKSLNALDFNDMSCEAIARKLVEQFKLSYCSVLEDGENGASSG